MKEGINIFSDYPMNGATRKTEVNGGFKEALTLKQVKASVILEAFPGALSLLSHEGQ